jgi:hypothetical protein
MPRIIGAILMIAGSGWSLNLFPSLARQMPLLIMTTVALGELPLFVWLLVKGVSNQRWKEQASHQELSVSAAKYMKEGNG